MGKDSMLEQEKIGRKNENDEKKIAVSNNKKLVSPPPYFRNTKPEWQVPRHWVLVLVLVSHV
jgi:hypothetical protein